MTPRISVITVCYNAASTIAATIASVREQTYPHVEHIVVDGASTDGTLAIVRADASRIATLVSQKDAGIFDAMNKGVALATGDVVYFLNADDVLVDADVLTDIARAFHVDASRALVYGNVLLKDGPPGVVNYPARPFRSHSISEFLHNSFCHQAVFARRTLFDTIGRFDPVYRFSADYEWIIRAFKSHGGRDFHFVDRDIAWYYAQGRSKQHAAVTDAEVQRMQRKHFMSVEYGWYWLRYVFMRGLRKRLFAGTA